MVNGSPIGGHVAFVAMHRTEEKPIVNFVELGADALMEPLVKFNYRAHGAPVASQIG